jgi:methionyl-tRNA synthetase
VTQAEAEKTNFMDPEKNVPLKRVSEESYFFRMGKYAERLIKHIEDNPTFIQPESAYSNILARLRKDELKDLSVSRTTFSWGIPLPPAFDQSEASGTHVMYVWFDALSNYLTGVCAIDPDAPEHADLSGFWPANHHVIGKDIVWFHCVIWPTILMSAGLPLPKAVFSHGFVNDKNGRKMSKSLNNSVDPEEVGRFFVVNFFPLLLVSSSLCAPTHPPSHTPHPLETTDSQRLRRRRDPLLPLLRHHLRRRRQLLARHD